MIHSDQPIRRVNMLRPVTRPTFWLLTLLLTSFAVTPANGQITSEWIGGIGLWDDPLNWSSLDYPHNNGTDFYNVVISGGGNHVTSLGLKSIDSLSLGANSILDIGNNSEITIVRDDSRSESGVLFNAGLIRLNATSVGSSVRFSGEVTLSGGGTISLGNDAGNQLVGNNNGRLINLDNLIVGSGTIGTAGTLQLVNHETVVANQSIPLHILLSQTATNTGLFRASGSATLHLDNGAVENHGGTIEALHDSIVNLNNTTIRGGTLQTSGTGKFTVNTAILDSSVSQVLVDGKLEVLNNRTLTVIDDLINLQEIDLLASSVAATMNINGTVSLSGGGTINFGNDAGNQITGANAGHLINTDHLIRGSGTIGTSNTLQLTNHDTIQADQSIALNLIGGPGVTNNGVIRAVSGATLNLTGGTFLNETGLIQAQAGSTVNLSGLTLVGGTLQTLGDGQINAAATILDGTTTGLTVDGQLNIANNQTVTLKGAVTNIGNTINLNATSVAATLSINGNVTLDGGGTIALGNDAGNQIVGTSAGELTNQDNLIRGSGTIGTSNTLQLINQHMIQADQSIALTIVGTQGVENSGTLRAISGATLNLNGGTFENSLGVIQAQDGSIVNLNTATIQGGLLQTLGDGQFNSSASTLDGTLSAVTLDGQLNVGNNQTLTLKGALANLSNTIQLNASTVSSTLLVSGNVSLTGGGVIALGNDAGNQISGVNAGHLISHNQIRGAGNLGLNSLQITNRGLIDANSSIALTIDPSAAGFLNETAGTLRASGSGGLVLTSGNFTNLGLVELLANSSANVGASASLVNQGQINIAASSSLNVIGSYLQNQGNTVVDGTLSSTLANQFSGGSLAGNGIVSGDTDILSSAILDPGHSAGILNFTDGLDLAGIYQIDLAGLLVDGSAQDIGLVNRGLLPSSTDFDQVHVLDLAVLENGLLLDIDLAAGYDVQAGDFFDVLTADTISLLGAIDFDLSDARQATFAASVLTLFDPVAGADRDVLRLTVLTASIPEPSTWTVLAVLLLGISQSRRNKPDQTERKIYHGGTE